MTGLVIGVGGTGARCVEALIHLMAIGLVPPMEGGPDKLFAGLVDPDVSNGSVTRTRQMMQLYSDTRELAVLQSAFFRMELKRPAGEVWPMLREGNIELAPDQISAREALEKQRLNSHQHGRAAASLMDVLYTSAEQTVPLDQGFRGRPAIGAAVFARSRLSNDSPFWKDFFEQLAEGGGHSERAPPRVLLVGSIFGGTGAAGVPTLARLIAARAAELKIPVHIGAVAMLPYFSFGSLDEDEVAASALEFDSNTKAALDYYRSRDLLNVFNDVYFLGEGHRQILDASQKALGGPEQQNPPHVLELCAALAAVDFFAKPAAEGSNRVWLAARRDPAQVAWGDLPYSDHQQLRSRIVQIARFALALNHLFVPALRDIQAHAGVHRAPWFVEFFSRQKASYSQRDEVRLLNATTYTHGLLEWLDGISRGFSDVDVRLLDLGFLTKPVADKIFPIGDEDCLNTVVKDLKKQDALDLHQVWERVCARRCNRQADGLSNLFSSILRACSSPE